MRIHGNFAKTPIPGPHPRSTASWCLGLRAWEMIYQVNRRLLRFKLLCDYLTKVFMQKLTSMFYNLYRMVKKKQKKNPKNLKAF